MIAEKSFKRDIEVENIFVSQKHEEALARLEFVVKNRGLGLVAGEPGASKFTLIRMLSKKLDSTKYILCYINNSELTPKDLYSEVLYALSVSPYSYISKIKKQFYEVVGDIFKNHQKQLVVIIDNAPKLPPATIHEIRDMTCFEMDSFSRLSVILFGQQELWSTLRLRSFEPVFYCISSHYHLQGLDFKETKEYIIHQLKLSERSMLFPDDVVAKVCSYSRGLPRIINMICTHCLIDIQTNKLDLVDMNVLERVSTDLKL